MSVQVVVMSSIISEQASSVTIITSLKYKFVLHLLKEDGLNRSVLVYQFEIFKPLSYCFQETTGFEVKALFARGLVSRLIKSGDKTKKIRKRLFSSTGLFID